MWGAGGIVSTGLLLIIFEVTVTSTGNSASGASGLTSLLQQPGRLAASWLNPSVPLVPAKASSGTPAGSGPGKAATTATVPSTAAQTIAQPA